MQQHLYYYENVFNVTIIFITKYASVSEENYKIRVGSSSSSDGGSLYAVSQLAIHPEYNVSTRDYDFGLMKLNQSLKFNNSVRKVKLPTSALKTGQKAVITGWGDVSIGVRILIILKN